MQKKSHKQKLRHKSIQDLQQCLSVMASIPQNIGCVQYSKRTSLRVLPQYCTKPIFCGIDEITVLSYG